MVETILLPWLCYTLISENDDVIFLVSQEHLCCCGHAKFEYINDKGSKLEIVIHFGVWAVFGVINYAEQYAPIKKGREQPLEPVSVLGATSKEKVRITSIAYINIYISDTNSVDDKIHDYEPRIDSDIHRFEMGGIFYSEPL